MENHTLLILLAVIGSGIVLGSLRVFGIRLGTAGVLFTGILAGALIPGAELPEFVTELGLVLFIYTVGLEAGPQFLSLLKRRGLSDAGLTAAVIVAAGLLAVLCGKIAGFDSATTAGMFCGAITNTPALAAVREVLHSIAPDLTSLPVVSYGVTYPMGVLGVVIAIELYRRIGRVVIPSWTAPPMLEVRNYRITNQAVVGKTISEVCRIGDNSRRFLITRVARNGKMELALGTSVLHENDIISVVALDQDHNDALILAGSASPERLEEDRTTLNYRRVIVSSPLIAGRSLRELALPEQHGALVTRVRREDVDILPHGDTVLEMGDRVRLLTHRDNETAIARLFGDSIRGTAHAHYGAIALGIALGILVGRIPFYLPGGVTLRLGLAGGTLITAMVLANLGWPRKLAWQIPAPANLTLREFGLLLFLAGVSIRSGGAFIGGIQSLGLPLFLFGTAVTIITALSFLILAHRWRKVPFDYLLGMLAALHTQPSLLAYVRELTPSREVTNGYASVYPVATIAKILVAQLLLRFG